MSPTVDRGVVGYVRVSSAEQGDSGLGLDAQRAAIEAECSRRGWTLLEVYTDVASGKSTNGRRQLAAALVELDAGRADALVSSKLDRVTRSVVDFGRLLERAQKHGWALVVLDLGLDMSTPVGELMANVLVAVAQFERRRIGERTREALAVVKQRGPAPGKKVIGRPREVKADLEARIVRMRRRGWTFQRIAEKLTADKVPTPTGGETWAVSSVVKISRRALEEPVKQRRKSE